MASSSSYSSQLDQIQNLSSLVVEWAGKSFELSSSSVPEERCSEELEVAVRAVQMACSLCQKMQESLVSKGGSQVQSKDENSPVTVADWSVQATVSWVLSQSFGSGNVAIVAEEDVQTLLMTNAAGILGAVVQTVNECLLDAPRFGFDAPSTSLCTFEPSAAATQLEDLLDDFGLLTQFIALGFVWGDQYAIALALIEDGQVVLGVLGCPNYPMRKEWLSYHLRYHRIISKLTPSASESWDRGCVFYTRRGSGKAQMQPILSRNKKLVWPNSSHSLKIWHWQPFVNQLRKRIPVTPSLQV